MFSLDISLFYFLFNLGQSLKINWLFIFFASYLPYFIGFAFLYLIYKTKGVKEKFYYFSFAALTSILSLGVITQTIRFFFHHLRPFIALNLTPMIIDNSWSFPSGHSAFFFAVAFCTFLISKKWGWILTGSTIIVVVSRIIVGVHWPSDILGGAIVAYISFAVFYYWLLPPQKIIFSSENKEKDNSKDPALIQEK